MTLLNTSPSERLATRRHWVDHFAEQGVEYDELAEDRLHHVGSPLHHVRGAWAAFEWVRVRL